MRRRPCALLRARSVRPTTYPARAPAILSANGGADAENSLRHHRSRTGPAPPATTSRFRQIAEAHKVAGTALPSNSTDLGYSGVIRPGHRRWGECRRRDRRRRELWRRSPRRSTVGRMPAAVQATVLRVSGSTYKLVLSTTATGQTIAAGAVSGDDVLSSASESSTGAAPSPTCCRRRRTRSSPWTASRSRATATTSTTWSRASRSTSTRKRRKEARSPLRSRRT